MTKIIAEAGVNHNGDVKTAFKLVEVAAEAGADFIKFQTFEPKMLVAESLSVSSYQKKGVPKKETQLDLLKSVALSEDEFLQIQKCCKLNGIEFITTAFDDQSLEFVTAKLKPQILKISSGDLTNTPFIYKHSLAKSKIILSTGMGTMGDIERALSVIAHGLYYGRKPISSSSDFDHVLSDPAARNILRENVTLLHCTTNYPTRPESINLACIETLRNAFKLEVGFSDHSEGIHIPISAATLGATIIEKHFTLDKTMHGPDHAMSIAPSELFALVKSIRDVNKAIGCSVKVILPEEREHIQKARKVLVASKAIAIGEDFNSNNITILRAGDGISPHAMWDLFGKKSKREYQVGEIIAV